jgi:hypothetical protein
MLNFVKADKGTDEMVRAVNQASSIINLYPEVFPYLYKQGFKLEKYIEKGNMILQDGVVFTFGRYKSNGKMSKNSTTYKKKGDFILQEIATNHSKTNAPKQIMDEFVNYCKSQHAENIFLTVRAFNYRAVLFYERYGFVKDSDITWSSKKEGKIQGIVFRLRLVPDKNIETVCI